MHDFLIKKLTIFREKAYDIKRYKGDTKMSSLQTIKRYLEPGQVYRRSDIMEWSKAVDRHLKQLTDEKILLKASGGLYYCPKMTTFGQSPADDHKLVETFLKDKRFLLMTRSLYNSLGVGTTQMYNETLVYNHKRHGLFNLGGRIFRFVRKPLFSRKITPEFLLVDLVDNMEKLPENQERLFERVRVKALSMKRRALYKEIQSYGGVKARKFFAKVFNDERLRYGA